ncbi:MAG: C1 family peptidase, partial [Candidatus Merdivicinus sp.]
SEIIRLFESEADKLMPKANPNRIGNYYRLMTADECRQAMFEGKMVLLGLMLPPEFANITKENPVAPVPAAGEDGRIGELLGHMVKAHGWRKGQIKCKNSWSEQWGEKGYFYLPDEYFMAHEKLGFPVPLVEAWAVEIDTETQKQPSGWYQAGEKWRYRDSDGSDHKGWLKTWAWFWLGTDGNMAVGWRLIDGKWYYFNSFGVMLDGLHTIDGKQYFFFERSEKGHLHGEMLKTNNSGAII